MTTLEVSNIIDTAMESVELAPRINGFHLEPRCRVCRNDILRIKVNNLLASGASYAMILRTLRDDNATLDKPDRITIDSIRNHTVRHFPVQNVAKTTYRRILEQRAQENGADFVKGVATAITPMAFYETVMVKGYETLVDSDTTVDVNTGMIAAGRLQALVESRAGGLSMAEVMVKMNRVIEAVRSTVPPELWPEIRRQLEGDDEPAEPLEEEDWDGIEPGDDPFEPDDDFDGPDD
jgi:hypothetical protein